ncbi:MAG: relaxase/mobilization nuclease domain-containing protein [Steroidobacteraceae bacterium]
MDFFSGGRWGPPRSGGFSAAQIEQIRRTVRGTPEVMVKVTGGGKKVGAVAAHLSYISQEGEIELETDEGQRVSREGQNALLRDWHLELTSGQYRQPRGGRDTARRVKLVHNIVLSMPAPTPPAKVLAAAKTFARENFGLKHRYAMALHTHQQHPHVHLVVKAEGEDGRRLHIDKALLREWRQDFARMMREQGIAANATPRAVRGQTKQAAKDAVFRAQRHGSSYAIREQVASVVHELRKTGTVRDPAHDTLLETRKAVVAGWTGIADTLDTQGEITLACYVRYFAKHLPPVLTDRERIAVELLRRVKAARAASQDRREDKVRVRAMERTR